MQRENCNLKFKRSKIYFYLFFLISTSGLKRQGIFWQCLKSLKSSENEHLKRLNELKTSALRGLTSLKRKS